MIASREGHNEIVELFHNQKQDRNSIFYGSKNDGTRKEFKTGRTDETITKSIKQYSSTNEQNKQNFLENINPSKTAKVDISTQTTKSSYEQNSHNQFTNVNAKSQLREMVSQQFNSIDLIPQSQFLNFIPFGYYNCFCPIVFHNWYYPQPFGSTIITVQNCVNLITIPLPSTGFGTTTIISIKNTSSYSTS